MHVREHFGRQPITFSFGNKTNQLIRSGAFVLFQRIILILHFKGI